MRFAAAWNGLAFTSMTINRRNLLFTAGLSPLIAALTATAAETGHLICPLAEAPQGLIPGLSDASATRLLGSKIYRGLCRFGPDGALQPDLAAVIDVAPGGLIYRFTLRLGLTWHDGRPVTAGDVVFSLDRFHRQLKPSRDLLRVRKIEAIDPLTVELALTEPDPSILSRLEALATPIVPQHVHDCPGFALDPRQTAPVGCGPFRVAEWLRLVRFDGFVGEKPAISEIDCPVMPEASARLALAQTGRPVLLVGDAVDAAALPGYRALASLAVEADYAPNVVQTAGVRLNPSEKPLDDPQLRAALACSVDREVVGRRAWDGLAKPAAGPSFDPRTASGYLAAIGLRPDDDGVRLRLTHLTPPEAPWPQLGKALQLAWQHIGIELVVQPVSHGEWLHRVATGDYQTAGFAAAPAGGPANDAESIPLVVAGVPVVRDRRLHWTGSVYGDFAGASVS